MAEINTDCRQYIQGEEQKYGHKDFCGRWFIPLDPEGATCAKCGGNTQQDKEFVEQVLVPNRVAHFEKIYQIRRNKGLDTLSSCPHMREQWDEPKTCCGGKIVQAKMIGCSLYGFRRQKDYCRFCARTEFLNICVTGRDKKFGGGIGDTINGLYVIQGFAEQSGLPAEKITYYTPYPDFSKLCWPNSRHISEVDKAENVYYLNDGYSQQLRNGEVRIDSYCKSFGITPKRPPVRTKFDYRVHLGEKPYVLLAPYCCWGSRQWPISHWKYLNTLLVEAGIDCVIVDSQQKRIMDVFAGFCYWALPAEKLANVFHHAALVVGNDSMAAHFGGLLGVKTLAIHAAISPESLFKYMPTVKSIYPAEGECRGCFFKPAQGYRNACNDQCHSIAGISPKRVFDEVKNALANN